LDERKLDCELKKVRSQNDFFGSSHYDDDERVVLFDTTIKFRETEKNDIERVVVGTTFLQKERQR